jgi:ABC-2 type transport system ATP-binding protein
MEGPDDQVVVSLEEAVKDYGSKTIGPISLSVKRGEVVGLLGPNGAGKSTSIRLLLGMAKPTSGRVRLMGQDPIKHHVEALSGVGYSPELPNLQTFMTPNELLTLVGRELRLSATQLKEQVPHTLESVGLLEYQDIRIGKLSKGMVQRLSVAQAMLGPPSLLILDEPMIGIDPAGVVHFRSIFRQFVTDGGTIIMSSHIMSEVESLCSSVAVVHSGRLIFRGGISDFIETSLDTRLVQLEVKSVSDALVSRLEKIPGVVKVTKTDGGLTVEVAKGTDPRSEISTAAVEMNAGLLSIGFSRNEIDDAYVAAIKGSRA